MELFTTDVMGIVGEAESVRWCTKCAHAYIMHMYAHAYIMHMYVHAYIKVND